MFGTDSPWTSTSPSSGYSRPTMCLMHTDLPVPDGPRIIEMRSSGRPMFSPRRILLRPKALWTSTNSIASSVPRGRSRWPVWYANSSSSSPGSLTTETRDGSGSPLSTRASRSSRLRSAVSHRPRFASWVASSSRRGSSVWSVTSLSASDRGPGVRAPEHLRSQHSDDMHQHDVQHHRLRGRGAHPDRATSCVVAVVAADQHDDRGHGHGFDHAVQEVRWVLEHPEDQEEPAAGDLADLLDDREVAGGEAGADGGHVHEGEHDPRGEQARRAQEQHRVDAHDLEGVDLVGDAHRAELRDDAGADLRRHHVAERVGDQLAQVAPGREDARVGRRADRAVEVRALDAALQAGDEHQAPDHHRRRDDQDAALAQRLAEEAEDAQRVDQPEDLPAELRDLAKAGEPVARDRQPAHYRITWISGWVASRVWVNT